METKKKTTYALKLVRKPTSYGGHTKSKWLEFIARLLLCVCNNSTLKP